MIQHFFYPSDHPQQDPVISIAKDHIENLLSSVMHEWTHELPPLVQGLVSPYHVGSRTLVIGSVESSLSRVVMALLEQLNTSNSKHLTVSINCNYSSSTPPPCHWIVKHDIMRSH